MKMTIPISIIYNFINIFWSPWIDWPWLQMNIQKKSLGREDQLQISDLLKIWFVLFSFATLFSYILCARHQVFAYP